MDCIIEVENARLQRKIHRRPQACANKFQTGLPTPLPSQSQSEDFAPSRHHLPIPPPELSIAPLDRFRADGRIKLLSRDPLVQAGHVVAVLLEVASGVEGLADGGDRSLSPSATGL